MKKYHKNTQIRNRYYDQQTKLFKCDHCELTNKTITQVRIHMTKYHKSKSFTLFMLQIDQ